MIYITGDLHANLDSRERFFKLLTEKDVLIVLGDFGFSWNCETEKIWNEKKYPFTTISVLGNHENYSRIYEVYPKTTIFGGKVYKMNDNTFYAKNGEVFEIEGKKFFVFGGALSIDKIYRIPYISWWPEEIPNNKDYKNAIKNLKKTDYNIDIFLSHTGSDDEIKEMFGIPDPIEDKTQTMISQLMYEIKSNKGKFNKHFFGHMHELSQRFRDDFDSIAMYDEIYSLDRNEIINF